MTIAIGFRCRDGVVLCADSEITFQDGTGKTYGSKIYEINGGEPDCYLVYAGDQDFVDELVDDLRAATKDKKEKTLITEVEKVYKHFWNKHYTQPPKAEKTWAYLLVTARMGNKIVLYCAKGRHFSSVPQYGYRSLGIGKESAERVLKPFLEGYGGLSMDATGTVAVYALRQIKRFVQGCGGKTEICAIPDKHDVVLYGPLGYSWFAEIVKEIEEDSDFFDDLTRPLLLAFLQGNAGKLRGHIKTVSKKLLARVRMRNKEGIIFEFRDDEMP